MAEVKKSIEQQIAESIEARRLAWAKELGLPEKAHHSTIMLAELEQRRKDQEEDW